MGGLRGGRGGGGGGGFEEESDSFDAMDDAKSLSDGCELFFGGGGGGGDESVGCCVVASIFFLAMSYVAPRAAAVRGPLLSVAVGTQQRGGKFVCGAERFRRRNTRRFAVSRSSRWSCSRWPTLFGIILRELA